jgi:AcrR family transcriptional regulator
MATLPTRRRTQGERSAAMRARLLEATVECLDALGFAGTTTTAVADRAGVSRGAQLHHYPTKRELVTAAIEHVLQRRLAEFRSDTAPSAAPGQREDVKVRMEAAVQRLWALTSGPTFYAWLELLVAARTDPALREAMAAIARRFEEGVGEAFREAFPELGDSVALSVAPWFTLAACQGFALDRILDPDEPRIPLGLQILASQGARALKRLEETR